MATVYLARDLRLGRRVAVKVMRPELVAASGTERFLREVQTVANLAHPHILQLHESGEADGFLFFVMPFVEGESLRQRLDREGFLPAAEAVRLAGEIADALAYADQRGIVHRDIKPGNIMLHAGHAVVSDFGIAKATDVAGGSTPRTALTETGQSIGTPLYMSPEQVDGGPIDGRSDIYALGCMLFEMLEGAPPYDGPTPTAVLVQHSVAPIPSLVRSRDSVAPGVEAAVRQAMAKAPGDRFSTAAAFHSALKGEATLVMPRARPGLTLPKPVRVAAGAAALLAVGWLLWRSPATADRSIAVLAFADVGADPVNTPFSDGVSDEITTALGKVPGLRVAARSLARSFKRDSLGALQIGQRLHVRYVLDGRVRMANNRRRVSVQLTDVTSGVEVWSAEYNPDFRDTDIFAVQDTIADRVFASLRIKLSAPALAALTTRSTVSPEAHDLFLKGRYAWNRRGSGGPAALNQARDYFQQAIALDSNYAQAWAGLADAYSMGPVFGAARPSVMFPLAKAAALRAVTLDSTVADSHTSLGIIASFYDWDWAAAGREFDKALAIDSSEVFSHQFRGIAFLYQSQFEAALAELRIAQHLDPTSPLINARIGSALFQARRFDEADSAYHQGLSLDSANVSARAELALLRIFQHRVPEALAIFRTLDDTIHLNMQAGYLVAGPIGYAYAATGHRADALRILRYLEKRAQSQYVTAVAPAQIAIGLGDTARALDELEAAHQERDPYVGALNWPTYDPLRGQPRFQKILRDMGVTLGPLPAERTR